MKEEYCASVCVRLVCSSACCLSILLPVVSILLCASVCVSCLCLCVYYLSMLVCVCVCVVVLCSCMCLCVCMLSLCLCVCCLCLSVPTRRMVALSSLCVLLLCVCVYYCCVPVHLLCYIIVLYFIRSLTVCLLLVSQTVCRSLSLYCAKVSARVGRWLTSSLFSECAALTC